MDDITRFDPFTRLEHWNPFRDMDDVYNRFMMGPVLRGGMEREPRIRMDVKEADGAYMIRAEIPGVNKDDIRVSIDGKRVSITAEVRLEKEEGERVICSERSYGKASRSFCLADEVEQDKVQAKYADGVLELTLPKKAGSPRREIPIS